MFADLYNSIINQHISVIQELGSDRSLRDKMQLTADLIVQTFQNCNKLLICGNGGSAADSQHIAAEFIGRFYKERKSLFAEALTTDTSILTALSNDYGFERIFARQIESKGQAGDVIIGYTTSGTSRNVIEAFRTARQMDLKIICFTGQKTNATLETLCDVVLYIPSTQTPRIQECHLLLSHLICEYVEKELFI